MSTGISWTDETWTVVTGCSKVSAGCKNCYAETLAKRLSAMGKAGYTDKPWTVGNASENVTLRPERLEEPLRWRKPRRVFTTSMGDLFHELVPFDFVDKVFAVMALAPQHTFQILTKRPERMAAYLNGPRPENGPSARTRVTVAASEMDLRGRAPSVKERQRYIRGWHEIGPPYGSDLSEWPLPNVWLGTSVEDQRAADERIPHLLKTPAAVRFLSCEPLIGAVNLNRVAYRDNGKDERAWDYKCEWVDALNGAHFAGDQNGDTDMEIGRIDWVIAGGESGPGHRPLDHAWMRKIRDDCAAAGVAFWAKQDAGPRSEIELPEGLRVRQMPEAAGVAL